MNEACPPLQALTRRAIKPALKRLLPRTQRRPSNLPDRPQSQDKDRGDVERYVTSLRLTVQQSTALPTPAATEAVTAKAGDDTIPIAIHL